MKIPNKRKLQSTVINDSSDINIKEFMEIYEKYTSDKYFFLVNDSTLLSDNPLGFIENPLNEYIIKSWQLRISLKMKNVSTKLTEKLQKYQSYHQAKLINSNIL